MSKTTHLIYVATLGCFTLITVILLAWHGLSYYILGIEERFFHAGHIALKPSGTWGHGYGIIGSALMLIGVALYMTRKRIRSLARLGALRHWLEFHIFLCTLGPFLVLFHTSFKFGGLVAISFWSMVAVFLSGIIGRFIYIQIPRTIEGREMTLTEIRQIAAETGMKIRELKTKETDRKLHREMRKLIRSELALRRKIENLVFMQNLFRYWHVAHLPFALVMLVIMIIHVAVTLVFGYRWIF